MRTTKWLSIYILIFFHFIFGNEINYYLYNVQMNYKEYSNGKVIDGDTTKFGDLVGIGIFYYNNRFKLPIYLNGEFAYGKSNYNGGTQSGHSLSVTENNVKIFTIRAGVFLLKPFYIGIGYRNWNRGKSDYVGDYNEKYYWPFVDVGIKKEIKINDKFSLDVDAGYQYAVNPKIDIFILNGTTLSLGKTDGYKFQLNTKYSLNKNIYFTFFYRYQYWHINISSIGMISYNNQLYPIYEPESKTKNQYMGIGILYKY